MADLMDHALAILGGLNAPVATLVPPRHVTKVEWRGCMATIREVVAEGRIVATARPMWQDEILCVGVRYDGGDEVTWEPASRFRVIGPRGSIGLGRVEVWS